jgi:hypothetical protein
MSLSTSVTNNLRQLYEEDFVLWISQTAELLREGKLDALDIPNLLEEVEAMGKSEKNALISNLVVVLMHLLKYQYQPKKRTNSWLSSIREHRRRLKKALQTSPSLKNYLQDNLAETYDDSRDIAAIETGLDLDIFPKDCPYSVEQILNPGYLPES